MTLHSLKKNQPRHEEHFVFFKRWLKNPLQIGAFFPSSRSLARLIGREVLVSPHQIVVELGGGTGILTEELIKAGVPENQLYVIEIDPILVSYLKKRFPNVIVLHGNAINLPDLIPPEFLGKVSTIVSGMPLLNMPKIVQKDIVDASFKSLTKNGRFIQYTYSPFSSLASHKFGLSKRRAGFVLKNFPPATIWCYEKN